MKVFLMFSVFSDNSVDFYINNHNILIYNIVILIIRKTTTKEILGTISYKRFDCCQSVYYPKKKRS